VIDAGSLSAAARRLDTTRSNVSRRLKTLERLWGVELLRRTTRRVEPTQIGSALYEHARRVGIELDALQGTLDSLGKGLRGHVRVSVPTGLGQLVLAPLLLEFAQSHPEVTLEVTLSNRVHDLVAQEIDVACRIASTPPQDCVARELARVDWVLCASPAHVKQHGTPRTPPELAAHPWVATPVGGQRLVMDVLRGSRQHRIEVVPRLQCADFLFLQRAVQAGLGLAALPRYVAGDGLRSGKLEALLAGWRVDPERLGDRLYLITLPHRYPPPAARAMIDFLKTRFEDARVRGLCES
jgi:DNA-binding transcriptional LysR family regulator